MKFLLNCWIALVVAERRPLVTSGPSFYGCGSVIKETAATIFSKNFNYGRTNYLPNERCNWTIETATEDEHIVLLFSDYFALETSSRCASDYVAVYDGVNKDPVVSHLVQLKSDDQTLIIREPIYRMHNLLASTVVTFAHHRLFHLRDHCSSSSRQILVFKVRGFLPTLARLT